MQSKVPLLLLLHFLQPPAMFSGGGQATYPSHSPGMVVQEALATLTRCNPPSGCFHGPFHPHTALLTIIDIRPLRQYMPHCIRLRLHYYKLIYSFRLSRPGGCLDPTESLAERQRRSLRGWQHQKSHEWVQTFSALRYSATEVPQ